MEHIAKAGIVVPGLTAAISTLDLPLDSVDFKSAAVP